MAERSTFIDVPGEWVRAEDYDRLAAELAQLTRMLKDKGECFDEAIKQRDRLAAEIATLRAALVGAREAMQSLTWWGHNHWNVGGSGGSGCDGCKSDHESSKRNRLALDAIDAVLGEKP